MSDLRRSIQSNTTTQSGSSDELSISLHDRRLDLELRPEHDADQEPFLWTQQIGLRFQLRFAGGRSRQVRLDATRRLKIAQAFAATIWNDHSRARGFRSPSMVEKFIGLHNKLIGFLDEADPELQVTALEDITPAISDNFFAYLDRELQRRSYANQTKLQFRSALKAIGMWSYVKIELLAHLDNTSKDQTVTHEPREPYPEDVVKQIFEGARRDVDAVVERILRIGPTKLAAGRDPAVGGWDSVENIMWYLVHVGPATLPQLTSIAERPVQGDMVREALRHLFPSVDDVLAFAVLLSLDVGLPVTSLLELTPDCLANKVGQMVDLRYHKLRSGQVNAKVERIREDTPYAPGTLVRTLLSLTARLRDGADPEQRGQLFLSIPGGSRASPVRGRNILAISCVEPCKRFATRHCLSDGKGGRLPTLVLARLRKTAWVDRYAQLGGAFTAVARDHTLNVAARHYGLVQHLAPLHDRTMREALDDALGAAMLAAEQSIKDDLSIPAIHPMVLDRGAEAVLAADKNLAAAQLGISASAAEDLLDGLLDVWIASCRDMSTSPFGTVESVCRIPLWGCLMCPNAVVTVRKLPAILSLKRDLVEAGRILPTGVWKQRFGSIYRTIVDGILPRFSEKERAAAAAAITDPALRLPSLPFDGV